MGLMRCMPSILRLLQDNSIEFPFFRDIMVRTSTENGPITIELAHHAKDIKYQMQIQNVEHRKKKKQKGTKRNKITRTIPYTSGD